VIHTPLSADVISFEADGEVLIDVEMYDLNIDREADEFADS